jgi:hypothetical protein
MAVTREPEILLPRTRRGAQAFGDESLDMLSHLLDDFIRIPGTSIRFGLDGIIALIPGVGDLLQGLASTIIIIAAWSRGVPKVTLARMVANVGIEVVVGAVPVVGDMFDIAFKANRRNYALLTGSLVEPEAHKRRSWIFFAGLCVVLLALLILPLVLFSWLTAHFLHGMWGR